VSTAVSYRGPAGQMLRAPKTAELIASHIRGQIVRGELTTGDTLPSEAAMTEMFGVSRPTLREAFRILETESLISIRRGARGGAQVSAPDVAVAARYVGLLLQVTHTTIADVYEARMVIEPVAAGLLAARRTQQDLDDLNAWSCWSATGTPRARSGTGARTCRWRGKSCYAAGSARGRSSISSADRPGRSR
jgi:GntR family transcriptional regulator, transcriptional repressor for pyruvate dehydrogenase complex